MRLTGRQAAMIGAGFAVLTFLGLAWLFAGDGAGATWGEQDATATATAVPYPEPESTRQVAAYPEPGHTWILTQTREEYGGLVATVEPERLAGHELLNVGMHPQQLRDLGMHNEAATAEVARFHDRVVRFEAGTLVVAPDAGISLQSPNGESVKLEPGVINTIQESGEYRVINRSVSPFIEVFR